MTRPAPAPQELDAEELNYLRQLGLAVDDLLEESLRGRENLNQTFERCLPKFCALAHAKAVVVSTMNEDLEDQTWSHGDFGTFAPGKVLADHGWGQHAFAGGTLVTQPLDVAGKEVGRIGMVFPSAPGDAVAAGKRLRVLNTIAEELDTVLVQIQTAAEKHQIILQVNELLSNPVFETGMDQAVLTISDKVKVPGMLLLFRDAVESTVLHYRSYKYGRLEYESGSQPWPALEAAIASHGAELIARNDQRIKGLIGGRTVENLLITGASQARPLGKVFVWSDADGFSAFSMDLIRVLASTLSQRLMDYNRERIHLSQFFSSPVIDELLQDPNYEARYLSPRDEEVGLLFADINGFTRICEQVLESPARIGRFVDRWSDGVVDILWKHGGVFDKMVGDCVIGLFGPPFFRSSRVERAEAVMRAAREIQFLTRQISAELPEIERIKAVLQTEGLGVAIGINLAPSYCGLFGPNQMYTAFSTGMNQTARLQSLGSFRETLVMDSVKLALEQSQDPELRALQYGPLTETPVKNVSQPLRHHRLVEG